MSENGDKPVDWEAVIRSPVELHVVASKLPAGGSTMVETIYLGRPETVAELKPALKASARVPLFGGDPVEIEGQGVWMRVCTPAFRSISTSRHRASRMCLRS